MTNSVGDSQLQRIQSLQFNDRPGAEKLLLAFVRETFPDLDAVRVELRPLAVSLNSFNGFLTLANGRRLFYKTHVEPGSVVGEYYNTQLLAEAGYPIIKPLYVSTEYGKQFLIYDVIDSPSVFDVAHQIELGQRDDLPALTVAQNRADDELLTLYLRTLDKQSSEAASQAAVHQLFYHRLGGRYAQFYTEKTIELPGQTFVWEDLCKRRWTINGVEFAGTLVSAIVRAAVILRPDQEGLSVIGHGDAHNGNVFFTPDGLVYFDPAFGGRHHPLLDLTKPLFHNVFATWMYHPQEVAATLDIEWHDDGELIEVKHNYQPSACRRMFFESKIERVLKPLMGEIRQRGGVPNYWRTYLRSALMCCPLLTMNLTDSSRFPPAIALLGVCYTVEMGLSVAGGKPNLLNLNLDAIEASP